jgi:hypothetical protein
VTKGAARSRLRAGTPAFAVALVAIAGVAFRWSRSRPPLEAVLRRHGMIT